MDEEIIDLAEYARRKEADQEPARATFAIWGGEGERARFALPLWRAAYLAGGSRASLVRWRVGAEGEEGGGLEPLVVLDLASDPARTTVPEARVEPLLDAVGAPALSRSPEGVSIYLGEREGRRWYLVVDHPTESGGAGEDELDDLYFLAGECAGLLFHRELDTHMDPPGF